MRIALLALALLLVGLFGLPLLLAEDEGGKEAADPPEKPKKPKVVNDERFHAELKAVAQVYKGYGRVDDDLRWAPFKCDMPRPSPARFSKSVDADTHGKRLYWLYAKKHTDYHWKWDPKAPVPVGQAIVKESWVPREVKRVPEKRARKETCTIVGDGEVQVGWGKDTVAPEGEEVEVQSFFDPYVEKGDKAYAAESIYGLFVMLKLDPKTKGTDAGWVYGTLTPDGQAVTSSGKVAACIKCHKDAPRERLYGLAAAD